MTTTDNAPVTAQDFLDAMFPVSTSKKRFEKLLSRACYNAFIFGRKAGLKEMDEAHAKWNIARTTYEYPDSGLAFRKQESNETLGKLRQEYSAK